MQWKRQRNESGCKSSKEKSKKSKMNERAAGVVCPPDETACFKWMLIMNDKILDKLLSGRLWITIIAGIVFATLSIQHYLDKAFIADIIKTIVIFYFLKERAK